MNSVTGKRLLAFVRDGDYAHPGEEETVRLLLGGIEPDASRRVLDAGCGAGGTARWVQEHGYGAVTGVEIDPETATLARTRSLGVHVVEGDLRRADVLGIGPFDLIYTMTVLHAVADKVAALRRLRALAVPGAGLRLFEYSDPHGRFATGLGDNPSEEEWQPVQPSAAPALLAEGGWECTEVRDLTAEFERWYVALCARLVRRREGIVREFGERWFAFALAEYEGILGMMRAGQLGGVLLCAHAA